MRNILLSLLVSGLYSATASADCYSHDGVAASDSKFYTGPELVSCGNGTSNCCLSGDKCGSNLLCVDSDGNSARQYCADKNWDGCSTICSDYKTVGVVLTDCGDNKFCCGVYDNDDTSCCKTDGEYFYVDPSNGDVKDPTKASGTASPRYWAVDSTALLASESTAAPSSASATASSPPATTTTSASTTNAPTGITSLSDKDEKKSGLSTGAAAGIGVGGAAVVIAAIAAAWILLRKKKSKNAYTKEGAHEPGLAYHAQAPEQGYTGAYAPVSKHDQDVYRYQDDAPRYPAAPSYHEAPAGRVEAPQGAGVMELPGNERVELA